MNQNQDLTWHETDLQLLEALLLATGGEGATSLQDVLLMADAATGSVLTLQELQQGLEKLITVEFVTIRKNKLAFTPKFTEAYAAIVQQQEPEKESEALLQLLQQQELSPEKLKAAGKQELKKYKLKNLYQQYLEQFG